MNIPFVNLYQQYLDLKDEIDLTISETIKSSSFITGPDVNTFESTIASYVNSEDCAGTGSGTTALLCALRAAGIKHGDEVITTPHTFVATTEAIVSVGAAPIFADIDPETHLINLDDVEQKITNKTKAILFVDIYGQCPDIDRIRKLCDDNNLIMIEDAAHSFGNYWNDRIVGSLADLTCFSFNPLKNLGAMGDAGCVTGSKELMDKVRMIRDHGRLNRYDIVEVGYNARIDNLQGNIIKTKLPMLKTWNEKKKRICDYYTSSLSNIIHIPKTQIGNSHSHYIFVVQTKRRNELKQYLESVGIQTNIHYAVTTNKQPAFKQWYTPCPVAERTVEEVLSIPCWYSMSEDQVDYVVDSIRTWASK